MDAVKVPNLPVNGIMFDRKKLKLSVGLYPNSGIKGFFPFVFFHHLNTAMFPDTPICLKRMGNLSRCVTFETVCVFPSQLR